MDKKAIAPKRLIRQVVMLLLAVATLFITRRFANRSVYLTSVLILIYAMALFFLAFERRRPQARELVILAVMTAIAVVARAAFIWAPHFTALTGVVIISGIALGAESGFLIGALSAFVSNFIFGQGAWTPWQMFAFGMAGYLPALLYRMGILSKQRGRLAVFGFLLVMLVVGPLLDTCALFLLSTAITPTAAKAIYISGLPVNAIHALSTALTIFFLSRPMFEKLQRLREKYGLMEG